MVCHAMLASFPDPITWSIGHTGYIPNLWFIIIQVFHSRMDDYIKLHLNMKSKVLKNIDLTCSIKLGSNLIRNKKQAWHKLGVVDLHTSQMAVLIHLVPHSGWFTNIIWWVWQRTVRITKSIVTHPPHFLCGH